MRVPLSWLREFIPVDGEPGELVAALDDLGLVVEGVDVVGEGLGDVVVARVDEIRAIEGADRIRLAVVEAGDGPVEVVCGAFNYSVGDLVPLAPVGAVLPGGFTISRRKMRGVTSNGMLCSGAELRLSDDHEGILVLGSADAADGPTPGSPLTSALGLEVDVVFDVTIEANRPDAASLRGVARDLSARLGLPFSELPPLPTGATPTAAPEVGPPVGELATVTVEDLDLCPRFLARVLTAVTVAPSPPWLARRLALAGMRAINNVVDASNYVMLELGQPTHPYDLDRLDGRGLIVRRARPDERLTTLDGTERVVGRPGRGPGQETGDCLICDARSKPVGIAGIMGGASSEISEGTTTVLLEAAYFDPMAVARTSKRLALRTEASARFEKGCDPAVLEEAADRIVEVLALSCPGLQVADGVLDVRGDVPGPRSLTVRPGRVNALLGTDIPGEQMAAYLRPLGFEVADGAEPDRSGGRGGSAEDGGDQLRVVVPTFRPDVRDGIAGEADVAEEVARIHGYARLARRTPSWPQPGRLTAAQRARRLAKDALVGLGVSEAWTPTFLSDDEQAAAGVDPPFVEVSNPLAESERFLRASMVPGLLRALRFNADRRSPDVAFFEVGSVFRPLGPGRPPTDGRAPLEEGQRLGAVFARDGDDAWTAAAAWRVLATALRLDDDGWSLNQEAEPPADAGTLHPTRSGVLVAVGSTRPSGTPTAFGVVGELHPAVVASAGLVTPDGRSRRVGWLDLDLEVLFDPARLRRRSEDVRPVSRFPSADTDLALVVDEDVPAAAVERTLATAVGPLLESIELFDVYRGPSLEEGRRGLAFRLRFSALDHTLTDTEIGELRARCVEAAAAEHGAVLRT